MLDQEDLGPKAPKPISRSSQWRICTPARNQPVDQAGDKQDDEYDGDELGDIRKSASQSCKTKERRSDGKYKESDYPVKHDILLNGLDQ